MLWPEVMRIVAIDPVVVHVPLREPVQGVHGTITVQQSVLVRVTEADGLEGWGDVDPTPGYSLASAIEIRNDVRRLVPALLGGDALNVHKALAAMDAALDGAFEAKAALEMALWDLKGRALGVPVHSLLGGRVKDAITLNAWIGAVAPEQAAREGCAWCERGFRTAKIKISGATDEGVERVAAVRAAVGTRMALRVDFNESLTVDEAITFIPRLEPHALTLVEQPIPRHDLAGLARIRRRIDIPLMADEKVSDPAALV